MTPEFWLWIGLVGMAGGAAAILAVGKRRTQEEETDTILHGVVPVIAAVSYFAMAIGQGAMLLPLDADPATPERVFYFARYIDWSLTTPLLLLALAVSAMHSGVRRKGAVAGLLLSDLLMIVTALFFGLTTTPWVKWTWYAISCGAFVAVYYGIWVQLREESAKERHGVHAAFRRDAAFLSVVWLAYPLVLAVGEDGLRLVSPTLSVALITVLDILAKVVFGLMATLEQGQIAEEELRAGPSPARGRRAPDPAPAA